MAESPDFMTFESRLHFFGQLEFSSGLRIGASRSMDVAAPDLPILRDALGRAYIPGSSFKGALRSYVESVLRALQEQPDVRDRNLACQSVGKAFGRLAGSEGAGVCLYQQEAGQIKSIRPDQWNITNQLSADLKRRLAKVKNGSKQSEDGHADRALRDLSCWTCRVFGSPWLASKVLIRDLTLTGDVQWPAEIRDGVAIDRDAGRAAQGLKYQFEILPAGTTFLLEMLVENASEAELGLVWLGIRAFERGEMLLGGAKSRGLGWCKLTPDWQSSRHITADRLLDELFGEKDKKMQQDLVDWPARWMQAFRAEITGGRDA